MKKVKLFTFAALLAMSSFALTSCGGDEKDADADAAGTEQSDENAEDAPETEAESKPETESTVMYQCPDNCDEGRAYFKEGSCKKCGKDLVEV